MTKFGRYSRDMSCNVEILVKNASVFRILISYVCLVMEISENIFCELRKI